MRFAKKKGSADGPQGKTITAYAALAFANMVVILILCGAALWFLQSVKEERQDVARVRSGAEGLVARLADRVDIYSSLLKQIARDRGLARSFTEEDSAALGRYEKRLQKMLPGAIRVRLLPAGTEDLDPSATPPLSFASLEMLRQAEGSEGVTSFEVHQPADAERHIAVATKVVHQGQLEPAGVILVAFSVDVLQSSVDTIADYGGRVELRQYDADGKYLVLASAGVAGGNASPDGLLPVPGTIWKVAYWASAPAGKDLVGADYLVYGGLLAGILSLLGIVLFFLARRLQGALKRDLASIVSVVGEAVKGRPIRSRQVHLREMWNSLELVAKMGRELQSRLARGGGMPAVELPPAAAAEGEGDQSASADEVLAEEPDLSGSLLPAAMGVTVEAVAPVTMPAEIFRAYDIRGVVGESLTLEVVYDIGRAIGSEAYDKGQQAVIIGRDGRSSSSGFSETLCKGLQDSGRDVIDLGVVTTPVLYFATHYLGSNSGVMVTGSHNPPEYNGLKVVLAGESLSEDGIQRLRERVESGNLLQGEGARERQELIPDYIGRILDDVRLARTMKVVVDCGNGAAATVAPELLRGLGCEVEELFCELDGDFPNHHPDPSDPDNLQSLILEVQAQDADIGFAFDGDGDRLGVVDGQGNIIWPDRVLMLLAADVLSRHPGTDIIYDVKCSRNLAGEILSCGGRPLMWKSGHSILKSKMKETGALLAGEFSGHLMFQERWFGFDDGLYAAARLLEILSVDPRSPTEIFAALPQSVATPELKLQLKEGEPAAVMAKLMGAAALPGANVSTLDGLRAEFEVGWGLVRASHTTPALMFRFEADDEAGLLKIQKVFRELLARVAPELTLPF